jgi:hypothetical protein
MKVTAIDKRERKKERKRERERGRERGNEKSVFPSPVKSTDIASQQNCPPPIYVKSDQKMIKTIITCVAKHSCLLFSYYIYLNISHFRFYPFLPDYMYLGMYIKGQFFS